MEKENMLLLGGEGFIGRNLAAHYTKYFNCFSAGRNQSPFLERQDDYIQKDPYKETLKNNYKVVIHLIDNKCELDNFIEEEKKLIQNIRLNEQNHFILFSSAVVHAQPQSDYGKRKRLLEKFYLDYCQKRNIKITIIRLFNTFGPFQKPYRQGSLIANIFWNSIRGKVSEIQSLDAKRDFLYIGDLPKFIDRILKEEIEGVVEIGSGKLISLGEMIQTIEQKVLDTRLNISHKNILEEMRIHEAKNLLFSDINQTPLAQALKETENFYKKNESILRTLYRHLLLGGTGFIGTELASALQEQNDSEVICVGRIRPKAFHDDIAVLEEDLSDDKAKWSIYPAENVYILVGQNHADFDKQKELKLLKSIIHKLNLWQKSTTIFYFSTALVYGNTEKKASEETVPRPIDHYSQYKLEGEELLKEKLAGHHKLCVLRLSNVYGSPKNRGFIGALMRSQIENSPLTVMGDGKQIRDYIYLDDVIGAITTLTVKKQTLQIDVVNIASGNALTLEKVINNFAQILNKPIAYSYLPLSKKEVYRNEPSAQKLRQEFGYKTKISFHKGLELTWSKYQE